MNHTFRVRSILVFLLLLSLGCQDRSHYLFRTFDSIQEYLEKQPDYREMNYEGETVYLDTLEFDSTSHAQVLLDSINLVDHYMAQFQDLNGEFYSEIAKFDAKNNDCWNQELLETNRDSMIALGQQLALCREILQGRYDSVKSAFGQPVYYTAFYYFHSPNQGHSYFLVDTGNFKVRYRKNCDTCLYVIIY